MSNEITGEYGIKVTCLQKKSGTLFDFVCQVCLKSFGWIFITVLETKQYILPVFTTPVDFKSNDQYASKMQIFFFFRVLTKTNTSTGNESQN